MDTKFDFNTIQDFDNHIEKSIPSFDNLMNAINSMSEYFITKNSVIYDLGCSTGKLLKSIKYDNLKIGYDNAKILPKEHDKIQFQNVDLENRFEIKNSCLVYSIFTMQFLNRHCRQNYCNTIYNGLNKGGALIICEKIYQENGMIQEILTFSHYEHKYKEFSENEIIKKEKDLRYIMKPNTMKDNIELLNNAGFKNITQFWQSYNFVGLIAIK